MSAGGRRHRCRGKTASLRSAIASRPVDTAPHRHCRRAPQRDARPAASARLPAPGPRHSSTRDRTAPAPVAADTRYPARLRASPASRVNRDRRSSARMTRRAPGRWPCARQGNTTSRSRRRRSRLLFPHVDKFLANRRTAPILRRATTTDHDAPRNRARRARKKRHDARERAVPRTVRARAWRGRCPTKN